MGSRWNGCAWRGYDRCNQRPAFRVYDVDHPAGRPMCVFHKEMAEENGIADRVVPFRRPRPLPDVRFTEVTFE